MARFVPNLAAMTEPISMRRITLKNHPWLWGPKQSEAFHKLRDLISSDTVLAHFDPSLSTQVRQDACKIVISGALTEKHPDGSIRPVAYASRSLSPVGQNSAIAKLKEKPYPECEHVRGFIFTSMAVSLT